mmetsp:Transcript_90182/g.260054  ORF Transcript_90182/g.260054 Transcript_90182/m.260054 type:complete len:966 (+) Transcript_90182:69-2966(+)
MEIEPHVGIKERKKERKEDDDIKRLEKKMKELDNTFHRDEVDEIHKDVMIKHGMMNKEGIRMKEMLRTLEEQQLELDERLARQKKELEELKQKEDNTIDVAEKDRIGSTTEKVLQKFLELKPRSKIKDTTVEIRFLPGTENFDDHLRIGGEGGGSLVAQFTVQLDQDVDQLLEQAAKYWSLDHSKVFFLDHNYRIVPDGMKIGEIVLPSDVSGGSSSSTSGAASSSRALAVPEAGGGSEMVPVLIGRSYILTLVRAGTVLDKEDLTKPKGEDWDDFTFEVGKLEQELQNTRERYGDRGAPIKEVKLEDVPSLYDIQKMGLEKKMMRRWDTRCRALEFAMFIICQALFFILLYPDDVFVTRMRLISEAVEQRYLDADAFEAITSPPQYEAYLTTTLRAAMVPPAMQASNLFVLGAIGYTFEGSQAAQLSGACGVSSDDSNSTGRRLSEEEEEEEPEESDYQDADDDAPGRFLQSSSGATGAANDTTPVCLPPSLARCRNARVASIFDDAAKRGHHIPLCEPLYSEWEGSAYANSLASTAGFSYIRGVVSPYSVGVKWDIDFSSFATYDSTIAAFTQNRDEDGHLAAHAKLIVVFVYSPDINGMCIFQLLSEHTLAGGLTNSLRKNLLTLSPASGVTYVTYIAVLLLSMGVLLMEVRRIFGCPKRFFHEKQQDRCTWWTVMFALQPICIFTGFVLLLVAETDNANTLLGLTSNGFMTESVIDDLYKHSLFLAAQTGMKMLVLLIQNAMLWRYVLGYFPQLHQTAELVLRIVKPLLILLTVIAFAYMVLGTFLYALYNTKFFEFHSFGMTTSTIIRMMMGGGTSMWPGMYKTSPTMFTFLMLLTFFASVMFLNNMAIAIMFSYKKEKDLRQYAQSHPFWGFCVNKCARDARNATESGRYRFGEQVRVRNRPCDAWRLGVVTNPNPLEVRLHGWWQRPKTWEYVEAVEQEVNPARLGYDPKELLKNQQQ